MHSNKCKFTSAHQKHQLLSVMCNIMGQANTKTCIHVTRYVYMYWYMDMKFSTWVTCRSPVCPSGDGTGRKSPERQSLAQVCYSHKKTEEKGMVSGPIKLAHK